jgi:hypothetical protein
VCAPPEPEPVAEAPSSISHEPALGNDTFGIKLEAPSVPEQTPVAQQATAVPLEEDEEENDPGVPDWEVRGVSGQGLGM